MTRKPKIVVADDEENILVALEFLLVQAGFDVLLARNGDEALDLVMRHHPDLLLLDVMMPRRSGYEVCQEIRARQDLANTRIVMLTARGREAEAAKGIALGADEYVIKPFSSRELIARLRAALNPGG
jgi:DNA-binding response OmpR family regulator